MRRDFSSKNLNMFYAHCLDFQNNLRNKVVMIQKIFSSLHLIILTLFIFNLRYAISKNNDVTYTLLREKKADFKINLQSLQRGKIQIFYELSATNGAPASSDDQFNETKGVSLAQKKYKKFDLEAQKNELLPPYTLITKSAYILHLPSSVFTKNWACQSETIHLMEPSLSLTALSTASNLNCSFRALGTDMAPGFDMTIEFYEPSSSRSLPLDFFTDDSEFGIPVHTTFQKNNHFTRVFYDSIDFVKRSAITNHYYSLNNENTLVISYSYSLFYLLPPDSMGGPSAIQSTLFKKLPQGVSNLDQQSF